MTKDDLLRRASKQLRRYSQADPMADEIDAALALPAEPKAALEIDDLGVIGATAIDVVDRDRPDIIVIGRALVSELAEEGYTVAAVPEPPAENRQAEPQPTHCPCGDDDCPGEDFYNEPQPDEQCTWAMARAGVRCTLVAGHDGPHSYELNRNCDAGGRNDEG